MFSTTWQYLRYLTEDLQQLQCPASSNFELCLLFLGLMSHASERTWRMFDEQREYKGAVFQMMDVVSKRALTDFQCVLEKIHSGWCC